MAIFVGDPQVSLTISQGSIIFFLSEDMSVMCPSLLTNSVGLTVKELELISNRSFSFKSYDMKDLTFFTYALLLRLDHPGLQYWIDANDLLFYKYSVAVQYKDSGIL